MEEKIVEIKEPSVILPLKEYDELKEKGSKLSYERISKTVEEVTLPVCEQLAQLQNRQSLDISPGSMFAQNYKEIAKDYAKEIAKEVVRVLNN